MPRIGLLVEHIYIAERPVWLATCHPDAYAALTLPWEVEGQSYFAVGLRPDDADGGHIVFADHAFSCRPAPALAKCYGLRGGTAKQLTYQQAAGMLLGAAHAPGARLVVGGAWANFVNLGES